MMETSDGCYNADPSTILQNNLRNKNTVDQLYSHIKITLFSKYLWAEIYE